MKLETNDTDDGNNNNNNNTHETRQQQEPLFALEEKFKSGEDVDAVFVMKELQKMARNGVSLVWRGLGGHLSMMCCFGSSMLLLVN